MSPENTKPQFLALQLEHGVPGDAGDRYVVPEFAHPVDHASAILNRELAGLVAVNAAITKPL